jgi:hypothetical protein
MQGGIRAGARGGLFLERRTKISTSRFRATPGVTTEHSGFDLLRGSNRDDRRTEKEKNMPDQARSTSLQAAAAAAVAAGLNLVRAIRESIGYSIEDLAVACGLTADEISEIEVGNDADPVRIRRIATALGIPEEAIVQELSTDGGQAAD